VSERKAELDVRRLRPRNVLHSVAKRVTLALAVPIGRLSQTTSARRRRRGGKPRILRAPVPIISIYYASRSERLYGYRSDTLVYRTYSTHAKGLFGTDLGRWMRVPFVAELLPYLTFLWALARYDLFVFFFDGGLLAETPIWRLELPLLRRAGKKVVAYPYGGDVRLPSLTRTFGRWHAYSQVPPGDEDRDEEQVKEHLDEFGRWADVILGCAELVDLPRLDGMYHLPIDPAEWTPSPLPNDDVVRIVHAPNHPHYKGTSYIVDAVEQLREEGEPVELVLVQGVSGDATAEIYARADIVVDQLLIGAYGQFAIECMALARPVVCFLSPRFAEYHPEWEEAPIVSATPDTITEELRKLVHDRSLREDLAQRGPDYVRRHHALEVVGAQMDALYRRLWERR
jgi:hypothetical protein